MFYKWRLLICGLLLLILSACFGLLYVSLSDHSDPINDHMAAKEVNGIFSIYDGKLYAMVPSNGYYEVKGANASTFQAFNDQYADQHIGWDDQHVYAGNVILPELDPQKLKALGNNYYTDGKTTYFCARNSERNAALGTLKEITLLIGQSIGSSEKPQTYWYPFVKLPGNSVYTSRPGNDIGGNAQQAFYRGMLMPKADPNSIRPIPKMYPDRDVRESSDYFTDGTRVYYQNQLLPLPYNNSITELGIDGDVPSRTSFLVDQLHGMVYADGHTFDPGGAPYKILSSGLKHANQALFSSAKGIYFYDPEDQKVKSAGKNPFVNQKFRSLSPDVVTDGKQIYYLSASEHWGRKTGLSSRSTHLMILKDVKASELKKIDAGVTPYNNIWYDGSGYFYFDNFGSSNFMSSAIYEIRDAATVQRMMSELRYNDVEKLKQDGALFLPSSEEVMTSMVSYRSDLLPPYWIILTGIGVVLLAVFMLRNKKIKPYVIEGGYLMFNNLNFKRYPIAEIEKVEFAILTSGNNHRGSMQIVMKNGKKSFNTQFSTRVTLASESKNDVNTYINMLQADLESYGIRSQLRKT